MNNMGHDYKRKRLISNWNLIFKICHNYQIKELSNDAFFSHIIFTPVAL